MGNNHLDILAGEYVQETFPIPLYSGPHLKELTPQIGTGGGAGTGVVVVACCCDVFGGVLVESRPSPREVECSDASVLVKVTVILTGGEKAGGADSGYKGD